MTPESIETGLVRVIIGVIGIVVAIVMLLGFIPSIALGLGGIDHKNIWSILYGLGFLLSFFGLFGAWWRLSMSYQKMTDGKITFVRRLLKCGVFSAALLSIGALGIFGLFGLYGVLVFFALALGGGVFLKATPNRS